MQSELKADYPLLRITIAGINQYGLDNGNQQIMSGRSLTWLQDKDANQNNNGDVWDSWNPEWRDVVILDGQNTKVDVYNLTIHDLAVPENYADLKDQLAQAAMVSQKPYTARPNPLDVDNNGSVAPLDALLVINKLNSGGGGPLSPPTEAVILAFFDVDSNLQVAPLDALLVINSLNQPPSSGEGESANGAFVDEVEPSEPTTSSFDDGPSIVLTSPGLTGALTSHTANRMQPTNHLGSLAIFAASLAPIPSLVTAKNASALPTAAPNEAQDQALLEWLETHFDEVNTFAEVRAFI